MSRFSLFDREPEAAARGLAGATEPATDEPVRAVIDLALIGACGDGKTELAATLIRTLRARAPELGGAEAEDNQRALRAVMGGGARPEAERSDRVAHYTFRIPIADLVEMLPGPTRLGLLLRVGAARLPVGPALVVMAATAIASFGLPAPLHILAPVAGSIVCALLFAHAVRAAGASLAGAGEVELAIWDPPGELLAGERAADVYDLFARLARRRRAGQPGWRTYAFVPALVVNPLSFADPERREVASRLRSLLPLFAALGGRRPRALVAINRWALVSGACPPGSSKTERAAVRVELDDEAAERLTLDRGALTRACIEVEDGRDGGLALTHVRYEASADVELDEGGEELVYRARGGGGSLAGEARTRLAALIAELALGRAEPPPPPPMVEPRPEPRPQARLETAEPPIAARDGVITLPYQPSGDRARQTLAAMTAVARSDSSNGAETGTWPGAGS